MTARIDGPAASSSERRQLGVFVLTGGLAAVVNIASRWLVSHVLPYAAAVAIAYAIGMITAFLLARALVFGAGRAGAFGRFALVNVVSFLVVLGVSLALVRVLPAIGWHWHVEEAAHFVGVASPILLSFYAHKHFSFATVRA